ncbi:GNAT family N-acetyltransferase [Aquipseudomonas alcaligenes]|uniref:Acetyltransferase (GNAT) family protein n=1 Tax=Aquipseudomonas alcaligenes TaxID=43263 RepID=A0A1N6QPC8_AQUAC|nr:GNAT family N-acetyltransferase [Pseudomonas alcaligenes]SIQ18372.1 Acetyltransferase (GNAT) family protein [Pseudomonas alcaligenes]
MHCRPFLRDDFAEYRSWYNDPQLNKQLGPMDEEWLEYVLNDSDGEQLCFFEKSRMVAVVGLAEDPHVGAWVISDIAVNPALRGQGIGRRALELLLKHPRYQYQRVWQAYVMEDNSAARIFFARLGWLCVAEPGAEDPMYCYRRILDE